MAATRVDAGATFLPICDGCGWRGLPCTSHSEALHEARHHERRAHPGDDQTSNALTEYRRRHA